MTTTCRRDVFAFFQHRIREQARRGRMWHFPWCTYEELERRIDIHRMRRAPLARPDGRVVLHGANRTRLLVDLLRCWADNHIPVLAGPHVDPTAAGALMDRHPPCEQEALIVFTSGTSSLQPKGVRLSARNIVQHTVNVRRHVPATLFGPTDRTVSVLPWMHCYGLLGECFATIDRGASTVIVSNPRFLLPAILGAQPTILFAVPRILDIWRDLDRRLARLRLDAATRRRLLFGARLRHVVSGGAALPPETRRFFQTTLNVPIYEGFGCSEMSPMIALQTTLDQGGVGKLLPGVRLDIAPDGELSVAGDGRFLGYLGEAPLPPDAAFATGDMGRVDADGCLHLLGRRSDLIKMPNGRFISLQQTEAWIRARFPAVTHVCLWDGPRGLEGAVATRQEADICVAISEAMHARGWPVTRLHTHVPFSLSEGTMNMKGEPRRAVLRARCTMSLE